MNPVVSWSIGGDFLVTDDDDDGAPLARLELHEPFKSQAIDHPEAVASAILKAMAETPHPYANE